MSFSDNKLHHMCDSSAEPCESSSELLKLALGVQGLRAKNGAKFQQLC